MIDPFTLLLFAILAGDDPDAPLTRNDFTRETRRKEAREGARRRAASRTSTGSELTDELGLG
jgi:hypothetical protein